MRRDAFDANLLPLPSSRGREPCSALATCSPGTKSYSLSRPRERAGVRVSAVPRRIDSDVPCVDPHPSPLPGGEREKSALDVVDTSSCVALKTGRTAVHSTELDL